MQISLSQSTTMRWTFDEDLIYYSNHSINRAGLSLSKIDEFGVEKSCEMLDDLKISVSSIGTVGFQSDILGPSVDDQLCQAQQAVRIASDIGAGCLLIHTGGPGGHLRKNRFCVARRALNSLLPYAEEFGVRLAVEPLSVDPFTGKMHSHCLQDCIQLIDEFDSDYLGINLDWFHLDECWLQNPVGVRSEKLFLVQLADRMFKGGNQLRCPLGSGTLNLDQFWGLLNSIGYAGPVELELFGECFDLSPYEQVISSNLQIIENSVKTAPHRLESLKI